MIFEPEHDTKNMEILTNKKDVPLGLDTISPEPEEEPTAQQGNESDEEPFYGFAEDVGSEDEIETRYNLREALRKPERYSFISCSPFDSKIIYENATYEQ